MPAPDTARATAIGVITTIAGVSLLAAPAAIDRHARVGDLRGLRAIGVLDLALSPGLLAGRPRWRWVAARAAANLPTAAYLADRSRRETEPRPLIAALVLLALTADDLRLAIRLRGAKHA